VNKDGTIRFDMTEMPISHFKAKEIGTSVAKLKELGYEKDIFGKELENDEQVLTMFPHDLILPSCPESADERADDVFLKVSKFIDDELEKLYGLPKFYNAQKKEALLGQLFVCIAPHICTATVGRLIGFSKTQAMLASPYMHAAMRRDCDGDEAAVMMLMDLLLNFSRKFLPSHRGGTQDAPLVLNTQIRAGDVDDQILDFELCGQYPLELYELAEQGKHSSEVKIDNVKRRLKEGTDPFSNVLFSHGCKDINGGALSSSYKSLPTMRDKVDSQMRLCGKIRAIDIRDVSRLIVERHFIRDIRGNLRKFSMQEFRCVGCNTKYRRPPLVGKCTNCGGKIIFTISEGSIMKYMQPALDLARTYQATPYLLESLELTESYIQSIFGREKEKQESIRKWF
jgi:DNA polymerase II large subunit